MTLPKGILLAAGSGRRFGSHKLLHPLPDGHPLGIASARNLIQVLPNSIAVIRPNDDELKTALQTLGYGVIENPNHEEGMGNSLSCVLKADSAAQGWVIALADMPWIQQSTIQEIANRIEQGASIVAPTYQRERGHPVGFASKWKMSLSELGGDQGARNLIKEHSNELELVQVDDAGIVTDIDYLGQLQVLPACTKIG